MENDFGVSVVQPRIGGISLGEHTLAEASAGIA
jgi:hypothetical protein